jgi:hypothetical protein
MPDENRFFRFVWRFNGIAIAVLLLVLLLVVVGTYTIGLFEDRHAQNAQPAAVVVHADKAVSYQLSDTPTALSGTDEVVFGLNRADGSENPYKLRHLLASGSYERPSTLEVNLLVVRGDGSSQWLFRGNNRAILSQNEICAIKEFQQVSVMGVEPTCKTTSALVIDVSGIRVDEKGEYEMTTPESLYVYRPGGREPEKFATADVIRTSRQLGINRYVVVSETGGKATTAIYSIPDFKLISQKPLPNVPK